MKTLDIRKTDVRLSGRFDPAQVGFPMMYSGACAELSVRGAALAVRVACDYSQYPPYLSFTVDGLRATQMIPLKGTHWYDVMVNMNPDTTHLVRITLETQAFSADPSSCVTLLSLRTDGALESLPQPKMKLEFIGDSITSGEGARGPRTFMEWVPMMFSASDTYARYASDALHAQYQVVSQSGWGVMTGWDNNPSTNLPAVYDYVCRPVAMDGQPNRGGEKLYDFAFQPDAIIINLGTNDENALTGPDYIDPVTGQTLHRQQTKAALAEWEDACLAFLRQISRHCPHTRILWMYGICCDTLGKQIEQAVTRAVQEGIRAEYVPVAPVRNAREIGSRMHPGPLAHRRMAKILVQRLRKTMTK